MSAVWAATKYRQTPRNGNQILYELSCTLERLEQTSCTFDANQKLLALEPYSTNLRIRNRYPLDGILGTTAVGRAYALANKRMAPMFYTIRQNYDLPDGTYVM